MSLYLQTNKPKFVLGSSLDSDELRLKKFLVRFPEYRKTLAVAVVYEESNQADSQGWQWHDVQTHPTKIMRLVTEGIATISEKGRTASRYALSDWRAAKMALSGDKPARQ